jgi:V4R domain.
MASRAENLICQIKTIYPDDYCTELFYKAGVLKEKAAPAQQAKFIKAVIEEIKNTHGTDAIIEILRPCGYQCISNRTIERAKKCYQESNGSVQAFIELLNQNHIGGGELHMQGNKIIGIYEKCYCGIPKAVKGMPKEYCECSAGWFEKLFSSVFERKVQVTRIETILSGSNRCIFEIEY